MSGACSGVVSKLGLSLTLGVSKTDVVPGVCSDSCPVTAAAAALMSTKLWRRWPLPVFTNVFFNKVSYKENICLELKE